MWQQAVRRVYREAHDFLGSLGGALLDIHSAGRTNHECRTPGFPVHDETNIALGGDVSRRHDEHFMHRQSLDLHPQNLGGKVQRLVGVARKLDPSCLSSSAGVHLRLDHHLASEPPSDGFGFGWCGSHVTIEHGNAGSLEQGASLIFVEIHGAPSMVVPVSPRRAAGPSQSRAMIERPPPRRTKADAASIFGFMPPASREPSAIMRSACATVILRIGRACGVPHPSKTASTLVRIISTSAPSWVARIEDTRSLSTTASSPSRPSSGSR